MMLACGHVLCLETLNRLAKGNGYVYTPSLRFLSRSDFSVADIETPIHVAHNKMADASNAPTVRRRAISTRRSGFTSNFCLLPSSPSFCSDVSTSFRIFVRCLFLSHVLVPSFLLFSHCFSQPNRSYARSFSVCPYVEKVKTVNDIWPRLQLA